MAASSFEPDYARSNRGRGLAVAASVVLAATLWLAPLLAYAQLSGESPAPPAAQVAEAAVLALSLPAVVLGLGAVCAGARRLVLAAGVLAAASLILRLAYLADYRGLALPDGRVALIILFADVAVTVAFFLTWRGVIGPVATVVSVLGITVARLIGFDAVFNGRFSAGALLPLAIVAASGLAGWPSERSRRGSAILLTGLVFLGVLFLVARAADGWFPGWLLFLSTTLSVVDGVLGLVQGGLEPVFGLLSLYLLAGFATAALLAAASAARTR